GDGQYFQLLQPRTECRVKSRVLFFTQRHGPTSDLAAAEEGLELNALLPEQLQSGIELVLMRFHEVETAALKNGGESPGGQLKPDEGSDGSNARFQIAAKLFVGQKQDVGVMAVRPPAANVLEPGAKFQPTAKKAIEEFSERPLVTVVTAVE